MPPDPEEENPARLSRSPPRRAHYIGVQPNRQPGARPPLPAPGWPDQPIEASPPRPGAAAERTEADLSEVELREVVERAWRALSEIVDRIIGSGRLLEREVIVDLARFLESAMPAVRAHERLVLRFRDAALAEAAVGTDEGP